MFKSGPDIAKYSTSRWWYFFRILLTYSPWLATILLIFISFGISLLIQSQVPDWTFMGLQKLYLISISGSVLASAVFFLMHTIVSLLKGADDENIQDYYNNMLKKTGIKDIFIFRGGPDPTETYKSYIAKAKNRVWVFGMSLHSFFQHHQEKLYELIESSKIDIRINFWDPKTEVQNNDLELNLNLLDIQHILEGDGQKGENWNIEFDNRIKQFTNEVNKIVSKKGNLEIKFITIPTNISCLVVDDEVFFFPFLSGKITAQQPIIHASSASKFGCEIINHLETIFNSRFSRFVYKL